MYVSHALYIVQKCKDQSQLVLQLQTCAETQRCTHAKECVHRHFIDCKLHALPSCLGNQTWSMAAAISWLGCHSHVQPQHINVLKFKSHTQWIGYGLALDGQEKRATLIARGDTAPQPRIHGIFGFLASMQGHHHDDQRW